MSKLSTLRKIQMVMRSSRHINGTKHAGTYQLKLFRSISQYIFGYNTMNSPLLVMNENNLRLSHSSKVFHKLSAIQEFYPHFNCPNDVQQTNSDGLEGITII